jgi:ABC-type sugar transport system permease subunit
MKKLSPEAEGEPIGEERTEKEAMLFLAIPLLCIGFVIFTIIYLFAASFTVNGKLVGLQNFSELFTQDPYFWPALWHNVFWMIWAILIPVGVGFMLAYLLSGGLKGEGVFKGMLYFPALLSGATIGVIWSWFFLPKDNGVLNFVLSKLGLMGLANPQTKLWVNDPSSPVPFLWIVTIPVFALSTMMIVLSFFPKMSNLKLLIAVGLVGIGIPVSLYASGAVSTSLVSILLASTWAGSAVAMVMFLAGMRAIPKSMLEAARVDCASDLQVLRHIILPSLRPVFIILIVLSAISSVKAFDLVYTLAGQEGGAGHHAADVLALYIYRCLKIGNYGYASAIGVIGILVAIIPVVAYITIIKRREEE